LEKTLEKKFFFSYIVFMPNINSILPKIADFFAEFIASQKLNYILWLPVFVAIGIGVYFSLPNEPSWIEIFIIPTPIVVLGLCAFIGTHGQLFETFIQKYISAFLMIFGLIALGFISGFIRTESLQTNMIEKDSRPLIVSGVISHIDQKENTNSIIFRLDNVTIENTSPEKTPHSLRVSSRLKNIELKTGQRISALMIIQKFKPPIHESAFDFRRYYYFEGVGGMAMLLKSPEILEAKQSNFSFRLIEWREALRLKIEKILSPQSAGIVTALMTGERAKILEDDWDNLRASGLAHIISISGLHVAMVATSIFFVVRLFLALIPFLSLQFSIKKIAAFVALLGCCLYVGFVVPTVPTTRALLMTGIALTAILLDRSPFSLRLIALSAFAILIVLPESLWSASFQLSFAAVTLLVWAAETSRPYWSEFKKDAGFFRKIFLFVASSVATTVIATIATAPYSSFHFGQIANYSVVANGLSIPLTGIIIMPMMIISFLALPFGLETWPLKIMGWGVDGMLWIASEISSWSYAVLQTPSWSFAALLLITFSGLLLCLVIGRMKYLFIIPLVIGVILIATRSNESYFISPSYKLLMVKEGHHVYASSLRVDKFAREEFLQRWGLDETHAVKLFPKEGVITDGLLTISCDKGACRVESKDSAVPYKITIGRHFMSLKQDCNWADIIITSTKFYDSLCKANILNTKSNTTTKNRPWII
jgi:competence protein ComEC